MAVALIRDEPLCVEHRRTSPLRARRPDQQHRAEGRRRPSATRDRRVLVDACHQGSRPTSRAGAHSVGCLLSATRARTPSDRLALAAFAQSSLTRQTPRHVSKAAACTAEVDECRRFHISGPRRRGAAATPTFPSSEERARRAFYRRSSVTVWRNLRLCLDVAAERDDLWAALRRHEQATRRWRQHHR